MSSNEQSEAPKQAIIIHKWHKKNAASGQSHKTMALSLGGGERSARMSYVS